MSSPLLELQRFLAILGYYPIQSIDGLYGNKTRTAITRVLADYPSFTAVTLAEDLRKLLEGIRPAVPSNTGYLLQLCRFYRLTREQTAYVLATVEHETAGTFRPVEEGYWLSPKVRTAYLRKKPYGTKYAGRGFVQITWKRNYKLYATMLQLPLVSRPSLVLDVMIAGIICVHGMTTGTFTGRKLADYINNSRKDYVKARRIVNGDDCSQQIAALADKWYLRLSTQQGYL